jgi:hypothetical protein
MRLKSFAFLGLVVLCTSIAACENPFEEKEEDETPTPTQTGTPTTEPSPPPTPITTVDGEVTTIDWGTVAFEGGESPHFDFTAPANTIGIDFMALGAAGDQSKIFGFFSMVAPGNRTVIDNTAEGPARQAFAVGAMSFAVPSDDSATTAAAAGAWRFHVIAVSAASGDFVDSDPRVLVKIRTSSGGSVPAGEIDVNVFIVAGVGPTSNLTATQACTPGNPVYDGLVYASGLYAANLSLSLAGLSCYDLAGSAAFTDIESDDELGNLFTLSSQAADDRLNLFIVDSFSGDLGFAAGVAGSVPIPMQVNGTRRSGVAIDYSPSALVMGETIAHEMGHSLGMYHTSEFNAATNGFDPISDTAQCPGLGSSDPGTCPDDTNVMFPQLTGDFAGFTAGQGTVLAPTVHVRTAAPAFAASSFVMPPPERLVWEGPPRRCMGGVVRPIW